MLSIFSFFSSFAKATGFLKPVAFAIMKPFSNFTGYRSFILQSNKAALYFTKARKKIKLNEESARQISLHKCGKVVGRLFMQQNFDELVVKYEKLVYTICYQFTKDHALSEDLAQETFLSAYSHLESCPEGAEKPWLARIATNKAKDHLKSAYNRRVAATQDDALTTAQNAVALAPATEDITISKESVNNIKDYILALKEPYHLVAVQFFLHERTVDEISHALKRPPKTVHTQLYRAKQMLREQITKGEW